VNWAKICIKVANFYYYLCQGGGYVIMSVCLWFCLWAG